jgi:hypothetical protein
MTEHTQPRSARIYQFPSTKVRANARSSSLPTERRAASVAPSQIASASFGSGWYHEAAIEEARRTAKS